MLWNATTPQTATSWIVGRHVTRLSCLPFSVLGAVGSGMDPGHLHTGHLTAIKIWYASLLNWWGPLVYWSPNQWIRMVWKSWRFSPINRYLCSCPCAKQPGPRKPGGPSGPRAKYDQFLTHSGNAKNHVFSARKNHEKPLWLFDPQWTCRQKSPRSTSSQQKKRTSHSQRSGLLLTGGRMSWSSPTLSFFRKRQRGFLKKNIFQVSSMKSTKSTLRYFEMGMGQYL